MYKVSRALVFLGVLIVAGNLWAEIYNPGDTIPLTFEIFDLATGTTISGESPTASIYRTSDGWWYDWDDSTFKATGWITREIQMDEVSADAAAQGRYVKSMATTSSWEQGNYIAHYENTGDNQTAGTWTFTLSHAVVSCPDCPALGSGSVPVNQDYPDTDDQQTTDDVGAPLGGVYVRVYLASNYDAGLVGSQWVIGMTMSDVNGDWEEYIWLDPADYVTVFEKSGHQTASYRFTVTAP